MVKFQINGSSLEVLNGTTKICVTPSQAVAFDSIQLYDAIPMVVIYNSNTGKNELLFEQPLSTVTDPTDTPFTVTTFIDWMVANTGFNSATGGSVANIKIIPDTDYTLLDEDARYILQFTADTPVTVNVTNTLKTNLRFEGKQMGLGALTFVPDVSTTINVNAVETLVSDGQFSVWALDWTSADTYMLYGRLTPA